MSFALKLSRFVLAAAVLAAFPLVSLADQQQKEHHEDTVSAKAMLNATVYNVGNPLGSVRDLLLTGDGTTVQYVIYEIPYPYAYKGARNGFAGFTQLDIDRSAGLETVLRLGGEPASEISERLSITRKQADHRLVSRMLGDEVTFSDRHVERPLEDILIDRKTGKITGYVINESPDAWFNDQPRVISPDQATISERGNVTTTAEFAALESVE